MEKETNIKELRKLAISFLMQKISFTEFPFIIVHPIYNLSIHYSLKTQDALDLNNPEHLKIANAEIINEINKSNLAKLFMIIRDPYKLTFLKYAKPYMSLKDFSHYFAHSWVCAENPNMDINCSLRFLVSCFKYCDKQYLMTEEDYKVYESLPDKIRVYRGVTPGHNPKGLSWTINYEKAKWFSKRFETEENKGYILTGVVDKKHVLAYFNTRHEDEVVCDTSKFKAERCDSPC